MHKYRSTSSQDLRYWQTVMEQTISATNAKAEAVKNRTTSLETELFRARVSRVELETDVSHVRRNSWIQTMANFRL